MLWFSLLVLIPLTAVVVTASDGGWSEFWNAITNEQTAAAIRLTVGSALIVTLVNIVMGTLIAWVLVRDQFFGKRALEVLIDIPFALPTIVAGLVLLSLYGPDEPARRRHRQHASGGVRSRSCSSRCRSSCAPCSRCSPSSTATWRRPRRRSAPAGSRSSGGSSCPP